MITTRLRRLATVLFVTCFVTIPAVAQLTVNFGSPAVVVVDGGAGDVCPDVGEVCIAGSLVFPGYTIVGPCTAFEDVVAGLGARMVLSECSVIKDAPAGPTAVPITFDSSVFAPLPATDGAAPLDVLFSDTAPLFNLSVTLDASTNLGAIGTAGPLLPPPDAQSDVAGPTSFGPGVTQLFGVLTFALDNVGDRIDLPESAQISAFAPAQVPSNSRLGLFLLAGLFLGGLALAMRRLRLT